MKWATVRIVTDAHHLGRMKIINIIYIFYDALSENLPTKKCPWQYN